MNHAAHAPRPTFGLRVLAALAFLFAAGLAEGLFIGARNDGWETLLARGAVTLLGALGMVAGEALWSARPWMYPASVALALAYSAVVLSFGALSGGIVGFTSGFVMVGVSCIFLLPVLAFVRHRSHPPAPVAALRRHP